MKVLYSILSAFMEENALNIDYQAAWLYHKVIQITIHYNKSNWIDEVVWQFLLFYLLEFYLVLALFELNFHLVLFYMSLSLQLNLILFQGIINRLQFLILERKSLGKFLCCDKSKKGNFIS